MNKKKLIEYTSKFADAFDDMLTNEESRFYVDQEDLIATDTGNEFFLAMSILNPMLAYQKMSGQEVDPIGYLEILIRLVNQMSAENAVKQFQESQNVSQPTK
jgi:hypothetical protein